MSILFHALGILIQQSYQEWCCMKLLMKLGHGWIMMTSSNGNISASLALCAGNSPVTGDFPAQRSVTRSFDVFFDLCQNKRLSKQSWGWWFETPSCSLWRHCNDDYIPWKIMEVITSLCLNVSITMSTKGTPCVNYHQHWYVETMKFQTNFENSPILWSAFFSF